MGCEVQVRITAGATALEGILAFPDDSAAMVMFSCASCQGRHGAGNRSLAAALDSAGLATLLLDLLTPAEAEEDTTALRFDIELLAGRLVAATQWIRSRPQTRSLRIGYMGGGAGAAAAVVAAARRPELVAAIVTYAGRIDLAGHSLEHVEAPMLLVVGTGDRHLLMLHDQAWRWPRATSRLELVPGAADLLADPATAERVARLAAEWFTRHLVAASSPAGV